MTARTAAVWVWAGSLIALAACADRSPMSRDPRTAIELPVEARDAVMLEMRTMLGSVNGILIGQAKGDTAAVRQAALASGTAAAADPALERFLPEAWLKLAMSTHQGFDELAGSPVKSGDSVTARLARVTGNCVACHAAYRLDVRR